MSLGIVTGYTGTNHITADAWAGLNTGIFGSSEYVLRNGNMFTANIISNTSVRILDGDLLCQGRHARQLQSVVQNMAIGAGAVGYNRNDLIVAQYTKTGAVEAFDLVVVQGTQTTGTPSDPSITTSTLRTGGTLHQMPLYRVSIVGTTITNVTPLFETAPSIWAVVSKTSSEWTGWTSLVLRKGQLGYNSTLGFYKMGDGVSTWNALAYTLGSSNGHDATETNMFWRKDANGLITQWGSRGMYTNSSGILDLNVSMPINMTVGAHFATAHIDGTDWAVSSYHVHVRQYDANTFRFVVPSGLNPSSIYDIRYFIQGY